MRWIARSVIGLAAGTCIVGAGLSGCGTTAGTGSSTISPTISPTSSTAPASGSLVASASGSTHASPSPTSGSTSASLSPTSGSGSSSLSPRSGSGSSSASPTSSTLPPAGVNTTPAVPGSGGGTPSSGSAPIGPAKAQLTLTGTVQEGVGPHCLLLKDEKTGLQVNLSGENAALRVDSRVTVVGRIRKDLMSYCQQGPIFVVSSATAR